MTAHWDPFTDLSDAQRGALSHFEQLLARANRSRNLISRASATNIMDRHVRHCLMLGVRSFPDGASVVDWGTGGGLPGIPLAIRFPGVTFHLVDSIFKKIWTVERFCAELELDNVVAHQMRAEDWSTPFDYAVSRATAPLLTLWQWTEPHLVRPLRRTESQYWPRGLIALKGGDLGAEMDDLKHAYTDVEAASLSLYELTGRRDLRDKHILTVSHPRSIE